MRNFSTLTCCLFSIALLSGCASISADMSKGNYKVGKPYVINGKRYTPHIDYSYSETGLASWYGPGFHGKRTANGERFNQNELTAAHRTLPMPSIVRVTNLENGRSAVLRINDRGPFSKNRIIDVSKRGAELLGFKAKGVAKVRVDILEQESRRIAGAAMQGLDTSGGHLGIIEPANGSESIQTASVSSTPTEKKPTYKLVTLNNESVQGHLTDGKFYPDPVIGQEEVKPHALYVQAGAFSSHANAQSLADKLSAYGKAQISAVDRDGSQYYRVRLPAESNHDAVNLAEKLNRAGYKNAQVIVE